jgi:hypothetical protein
VTTLNFHWFEHPLHSRAPCGGEEGVDGRFYRGGEFEAFYIPRPVMPQVDEADQADLIAFIRERGIEVTEETVPPEDLHFHQRVDMKKVHAMAQDVLDKPLLVSLDMYVLDGNHRAAGHKQVGTPANCIVIGAKFEDAMAVIYAFPKTYEYGDGNFHPVVN